SSRMAYLTPFVVEEPEVPWAGVSVVSLCSEEHLGHHFEYRALRPSSVAAASSAVLKGPTLTSHSLGPSWVGTRLVAYPSFCNRAASATAGVRSIADSIRTL